jgi:tryptophanyl-tRNA synthetase
VCQLRRIYDPTGHGAQWDECRSGARGCVQSKRETTDILVEALAPIRERRARYENDTAELDHILARGADQARAFAEDTLRQVREVLRLV